uniref:MULE transposase domain-containing protein n=1 Tax=Plectus sambesii TaxID=2011161 RepID=A0A914XGD7_9BILA
MSLFYDVEFQESKKGKNPIAVYRLNHDECNTFYYQGCGRKDTSILYYSCLQCKKVDGKVKGGKTVHIKGTSVLNGNPRTGHKTDCKPERAAAVHAESFKRKASKEVRAGISTVGNARLNNLAEMTAACAAIGVDRAESQKNWLMKSVNARLNYNKTSRIAPAATPGNLPEELKVTFTGEPFLRFESDDGLIKVFVSDVGLDLLRRAPMWKADGTFKSAPREYMQVYTLHARHPRGETVVALHAIMKRKTQKAYRQLFSWLNSMLEESQSIGALRTILIDFEPAAKKAFESELCMADRAITIKGCRFHFGQAVSRNFDKKGLKPLRDNLEFNTWKQHILGLPLLPPQYVRFVWESALRHHPKVHGYNRQFKNFVKYFENQWLSTDDYIAHWNHWDNELCRTTNSAEGWHSGLKATWSGVRPVVSTYVEWLKKKEVEHATRITQLDDDSFPTKKRVAAYVLLDERIHEAKVRFSALEVLELDNNTPDMLPIILRHLRYVSCLLGNKKNVAAAPAAPPVDPSAISLFEPISTIDAAISSVVNAAVRRCPALVHTYLPPCIHQRPAPIVPTEGELSDDSINDSSDDETEEAENAPEPVYEPCKECGDRTAERCAACKLPMHFNCGGVRDEDTISLCDSCCHDIADVSNIEGRMARRRELERRLAPIYGLPLED